MVIQALSTDPCVWTENHNKDNTQECAKTTLAASLVLTVLGSRGMDSVGLGVCGLHKTSSSSPLTRPSLAV